ncbi:MAG: hypothetical protein ACE5F1_16055 [Planctomycetota bacterium]
MVANEEFVPLGDGSSCPRCGSLLGRLERPGGARGGDPRAEPFCPSPVCNDGVLLHDADASYLYRAWALIFTRVRGPGLPDKSESERLEEHGVIRAVRPEGVHDPIVRRNSPIVAAEVRWPADRKRFSELFDHHVHHETAPHITPLNDGWDSQHSLPVL